VLIIMGRSLVVALFLFILARVMGKKQISQLTFFDYIVGITIGSVAASTSTDPQVTLLAGLSSVLVWGFLPIVLGWLGLKSALLRKWIDGEPTVVIRDGQIMEESMGTARYNLDDLLMQLRLNKAYNLSDVEVAMLEPNGQLSVLKKSDSQPLSPRTLNIPVSQRGMPSVVVEDGRLMRDTMEHLGKSEEWLRDRLGEQGVESLEEVMLAQVDGYDNLYIDLKDDARQKYPPQTEKRLAADLQALEADLRMFALETDSLAAKRLYQQSASRLRQIRRRVIPLILH